MLVLLPHFFSLPTLSRLFHSVARVARTTATSSQSDRHGALPTAAWRDASFWPKVKERTDIRPSNFFALIGGSAVRATTALCRVLSAFDRKPLSRFQSKCLRRQYLPTRARSSNGSPFSLLELLCPSLSAPCVQLQAGRRADGQCPLPSIAVYSNSRIRTGTSGLGESFRLFSHYDRRRFGTSPLDLKTELSLFRDTTEEDLRELRELSLSIMSDPVTVITPEETETYLVTRRREDRSPAHKLVHWIRGGRYKEAEHVAYKMMCLVCERLENELLTEACNIDHGFNSRAYFLTLHVWLLHKRLVLEPMLGYLIDNQLFKLMWELIQHWMLLKEVPLSRFDEELSHVQCHMFGLMLCLDDALCRTDILPARINEALWGNIYSEFCSPEDDCVLLVTKYVIRQLTHILQMKREHLLGADFVWADVIIPQRQVFVKNRVVPALSYKPLYGGYLPPEENRLQLAQRKRKKPQPQFFDHAAPIDWPRVLEATAAPATPATDHHLLDLDSRSPPVSSLNEQTRKNLIIKRNLLEGWEWEPVTLLPTADVVPPDVTNKKQNGLTALTDIHQTTRELDK